MPQYVVKYESGFDGNGIPFLSVETVDSDYYSTNATSGAGLVADFHMNGTADPIATYGRVHSVRKSGNQP